MKKAKQQKTKGNKITVPKLYKMVRSMSPEVKEITYQYTNIAGTSFSSVSFGSDSRLAGLGNGIVQGSGVNNRVGNEIKVIGVKIYLAMQNASLDLFNNMRVFLVRPKTDIRGTGAVLAQNIMSGVASSALQWASPIDTDRYIVYVDKVYNLHNVPNDGSSSTSIQPTRFLKKFIKLNAKLQWDAEGVLSKDLILGAISDSGAIPNPGCIAGHVKLYFTDN